MIEDQDRVGGTELLCPGNESSQETHPLPRGGTDLIGRGVSEALLGKA